MLDEEAEAEERQEEFYLDVYCDAQSKKRDEVNGAIVVLKDGKARSKLHYTPLRRQPNRHTNTPLQVRLWPKNPVTNLPADDPDSDTPPHPFTGFYLPFPNDDLPHRPIPAAPILGLVTTVPSSTRSNSTSPASSPSPTKPTKPKLNWLYADVETRELRYGPRSEAKKHTIGPWDWTEDEQGVTLEDEECLVAVEEERGGYGWAVYWDREDDCLKGHGLGKEKRVLRCSLERRLIEEQRVKGLDED